MRRATSDPKPPPAPLPGDPPRRPPPPQPPPGAPRLPPGTPRTPPREPDLPPTAPPRGLTLEARLEALEAENGRRLIGLYLLSERISALETRVGMPEPAETTGLLTVKMAAHRSGYTESGIRSLVRKAKLAHRWIGRRVFIVEAALPAKRTHTLTG